MQVKKRGYCEEEGFGLGKDLGVLSPERAVWVELKADRPQRVASIPAGQAGARGGWLSARTSLSFEGRGPPVKIMPMFKIGVLMVRTLSKPIAAAIKKRATERPSFRTSCASFAQWWHRMEVSMQVQLMGHTAHSIKPLSEADAVRSGAEILGEGVIFSIAALLMLVENRRSAMSDAAKKDKIQSEFETIKARLEELEEAMEVTRKDTTDLMISGGKVSKEKIMSRLKGEEERMAVLGELEREDKAESWTEMASRWIGLAGAVTSGDEKAVKVASDAAVAAVTPSVVTSFFGGTVDVVSVAARRASLRQQVSDRNPDSKV